MTSASTRPSLALGVAALAVFGAGCAGRHVSEMWYPIPDQSAPPTAPDVRGTKTAAAAIPNDQDTEIIRNVVIEFYFPVRGQVRWIDPRPLAHVRGAADDTVGADFDWVDEIVALAHRSTICALDGRLEMGGTCKGKPGGVLRFSTPYSVGKDSALVYATWAPVDSAGKFDDSLRSEMQFRLKRREDSWEIIGKTTISMGSKPKAP